MQTVSVPGPFGPRLLKVPQAAEALNLSVRSTWRLVSAGHLRIVRAGRSARVPAEGPGSVSEFISKGGTES